MQKAVNLFNKAEIWFFYGLLATFTLSIRKVLFFYPIKGQFNEYSGIYLYLSDIFLFLVLACWFISIPYNKTVIKSRCSLSLLPYLKQKSVLLPLLLVGFSFVSILWSDNHNVAIFRSLKLLEFCILYFWVIFRIVPFAQQCSTWNIARDKRGTSIFKRILEIIIAVGLIQSIVGIWQFIAQKSIGLIWLKESVLSPDISGVAKIVFNGEKYIRAYGLLPHPNILGGFLILSIVLTIMYFRLFHVEQSEKKIDNICSTWNIYAYYVILGIQFLALVLTFSKSAYIGLLIALFYLWYQNVPRGTFNDFVAEKIKYFLLVACIFILLIIVAKPNWYSVIGKSIDDRVFYLNVSRGTFLENPILGVGSGQFVSSLENIKNIENWQFQPIHDVFLLILNELGIIGFILFLWFIWGIMRIVSSTQQCSTWNIVRDKRETIGGDKYFKALFFGFLFVMIVDHYFWDIQQGQIMLWLILGFMVGGNVCATSQNNTYPQDKR
jgi:hypothetical protein